MASAHTPVNNTQEETVPGDHTLISWDKAVCGEKLHKEIWAWVRVLI